MGIETGILAGMAAKALGAGTLGSLAAGVIGTGAAWALQKQMGTGVGAMMGGKPGGGTGGMTWIKPPKAAQKLMGEEYAKEKAEIGQEAQVAKAAARQSLTSRGLTGTTMQEAYQTRISQDTAKRLESLAGRYALSQYGAYQPVIRGAPGPGPFSDLLSGLGQGIGKNPMAWGGMLKGLFGGGTPGYAQPGGFTPMPGATGQEQQIIDMSGLMGLV